MEERVLWRAYTHFTPGCVRAHFCCTRETLLLHAREGVVAREKRFRWEQALCNVYMYTPMCLVWAGQVGTRPSVGHTCIAQARQHIPTSIEIWIKIFDGFQAFFRLLLGLQCVFHVLRVGCTSKQEPHTEPR